MNKKTMFPEPDSEDVTEFGDISGDPWNTIIDLTWLVQWELQARRFLEL